MKKYILEAALSAIVNNPSILDNLSLPNINLPTLGGICFWNDLCEMNGWRIQKNTVFQQVRILDPYDVRRAWGGLSAIEKLFDYLAK